MNSLFLTILMLIPVTAAYGSERIFIGQVSEILLIPEGHEMCPSLCPDDPIEVDGKVRICVSNSCGCGEARIQVHRSLTSLPKGRETTVHYRIGEWCMAGFPLTGETILIWEVPGRSPAWGSVNNPGTRRATFDPEDFKHLESAVLQSVLTDSGNIRISELRRAIRSH